MQNVLLFYKICVEIRLLTKKKNKFKDLSLDEKNHVRKFYDAKIHELDKAQKLNCRETTIQVALQLTLISYQEILV